MLLFALIACGEPEVVDNDADGDGVPVGEDCDDTDAFAYPGSAEFCDGVDNDCNGSVDDEAWDAQDFFEDVDGDGWGDALRPSCSQPDGFSDRGGDCDDDDPQVRPGAAELCNGIDDDCDGTIDVSPEIAWYPDADGDGYGDPDGEDHTCDPPADWVDVPRDCNDADPAVNPAADERCNGFDDDCDGDVDDADSAVTEAPIWYPDGDGDGFGADAFEVQSCDPPVGDWSSVTTDCDDFDGTVFPGAVELCDGQDNDCDQQGDPPDARFGASPRVPLTLTSAADLTAPMAVVPFDLEQAVLEVGHPDPGNPDGVRVVLGSCEAGFLELPAAVDGDVLRLVFDIDGDAATQEVLGAGSVEGWLHFQDTSPFTGVSAGADEVLNGGARVAVGSNGLLATEISYDTSGFLGASRTPRAQSTVGTLLLDPPLVGEVRTGAALAAVQAAGSLDDGAARVEWTVRWWAMHGRPEIFGSLEVTALAGSELEGVPTWPDAVRGAGFDLAQMPVSIGSDWYAAVGSHGVGVRVVDGGPVTVDSGGLTLGSVILGPPLEILAEDTLLLRSTVALLVHQGGEAEAEQTLLQLDSAPQLDLGTPEP